MVQSIFSKCIAIVFSIAAVFSLATISYAQGTIVTYENFGQVETSMQMDRYKANAKGINKWYHIRKPAPYNAQTTIRLNRDTLYSFALVNVKKNAKITLPDNGERYMSLMPVNELGYTNEVWYGKGNYEITSDIIGSDYVLLIVRILVDANNPADVQKANDLQDMLQIQAKDNTDYIMPKWDKASYDKIYESLLAMSQILDSTANAFGKKTEVDPLRHIVCTAAGYGGLPTKDAYYLNGAPMSSQANYKIVVKDVPVDGFWSFTVYDEAGYLFESKDGLSSLNNLTATPSADGAYTIYFGNCAKNKVNCLATKDGWNYIVRLYEPQAEILSGIWELPALQEVK